MKAAEFLAFAGAVTLGVVVGGLVSAQISKLIK